MAFLKRKLIPYIAGSVIPQTALIPAEAAKDLISVFLQRKATAREAPPCAILETIIPGPATVSNPVVANKLIPIGINP